MRLPHHAEWEWGWKTPLLLRFPDTVPPEISNFVETPLGKIPLVNAEVSLEERLRNLKTSRIGIRFERIQEALFRNHPDTETLRAGLVIPHRTEIDLLHRLKTLPETVVHWEIAVKFYLGLDDGGSDEADRFIGPSLKDTLGIKTRTIFGKQLAILRDPIVRSELGPTFGISPEDSVLSLPKVHGVLYLPFRAMSEVRRPPGISETGLRGAWLTLDALARFIELMIERYPMGKIRWMLERREWIRDQSSSSAPAELETDLKSYFNSELSTQIQSYFQDKIDPIHGVVLDRNEDGSTSELRFFIVPPHWPEEAERALETLRTESRIKV